jgi:hypothetical protein
LIVDAIWLPGQEIARGSIVVSRAGFDVDVVLLGRSDDPKMDLRT